MVGDPGTGKSQLLRSAVQLTPRSVFTCGSGSTAAGLGCTAVKEDGLWHLEAGALVLTDKGICCIDELSTLKEQDRVALHEAMEQQTLSLAKAGLVAKLNTRCSLVASTNSKLGKYDPNQDISLNTTLSGPLLSRFDLIMLILDKKNPDWDKRVSDFLLGITDQEEPSIDHWSKADLRAYFSAIRPLRPTMDKDAQSLLSAYFRQCRQSQGSDSQNTIRLLESVIRLSQAHAKLMLHKSVTVLDALVVVELMEACRNSIAHPGSLDLRSLDFAPDPVEALLASGQNILTKLNLPQLLPILEQEVNSAPDFSILDPPASKPDNRPSGKRVRVEKSHASCAQRAAPAEKCSTDVSNDLMDNHRDSTQKDRPQRNKRVRVSGDVDLRESCRGLAERRISTPSTHVDASVCQITTEMGPDVHAGNISLTCDLEPNRHSRSPDDFDLGFDV